MHAGENIATAAGGVAVRRCSIENHHPVVELLFGGSGNEDGVSETCSANRGGCRQEKVQTV